MSYYRVDTANRIRNIQIQTIITHDSDQCKDNNNICNWKFFISYYLLVIITVI